MRICKNSRNRQEHPHALPRRRNEILTGDIDPLSQLPPASDRRNDDPPAQERR
jgi:hypothetical protein